jgi:hypothetical protein
MQQHQIARVQQLTEPLTDAHCLGSTVRDKIEHVGSLYGW